MDEELNNPQQEEDSGEFFDLFDTLAAPFRGIEGALQGVYNLADYVVDVEPHADMDYTDALITAMRKEKAAYRLYLELAATAEAEELANIFLSLAQEEARHKLRFEIEYDDVVLKED